MGKRRERTRLLTALLCLCLLFGGAAEEIDLDAIYQWSGSGTDGQSTHVLTTVLTRGRMLDYMVFLGMNESPELAGPALAKLMRQARQAYPAELDLVAGAEQTSARFIRALEEAYNYYTYKENWVLDKSRLFADRLSQVTTYAEGPSGPLSVTLQTHGMQLIDMAVVCSLGDDFQEAKEVMKVAEGFIGISRVINLGEMSFEDFLVLIEDANEPPEGAVALAVWNASLTAWAEVYSEYAEHRKQTLGLDEPGVELYSGRAVVESGMGYLSMEVSVKEGRIRGILPECSGSFAQISIPALDLLTAQAVQNNGARVDVVTGASQTSQVFLEALGQALEGVDLAPGAALPAPAAPAPSARAASAGQAGQESLEAQAEPWLGNPNSTWSQTPDQVRAEFGQSLRERRTGEWGSDFSLVTSPALRGKAAEVEHFFKGGRLFYLEARLNAPGALTLWTPEELLVKFDEIKASLAELFGGSVDDREDWQTPAASAEFAGRKAEALAQGLLALEVWFTDDSTLAILRLGSVEGTVRLNLSFNNLRMP